MEDPGVGMGKDTSRLSVATYVGGWEEYIELVSTLLYKALCRNLKAAVLKDNF